MKKLLFVLCAAVMGLSQVAHAGIFSNYNYVSADELKGWLEASKSMLIVDIQEKKDFTAHHLKGSLETNAYPVKSDTERHTLDPALTKDQAEHYSAVVVVCPRGKGGAKRAYEYLANNGIPESKLYILTGGMEHWPHQEWVAAD